MAIITLREVAPDDLPTFYAQQLDPDANYRAAFIRRDPGDRAAFDAHWAKLLADKTTVLWTIVLPDGQIAGYLVSFMMDDEREVGYWLGRDFWGRGIATEALRQIIALLPERPLHARAAKDNIASIRVLRKCGFEITGEDVDYAAGRGLETEELLLLLK